MIEHSGLKKGVEQYIKDSIKSWVNSALSAEFYKIINRDYLIEKDKIKIIDF